MGFPVESNIVGHNILKVEIGNTFPPASVSILHLTFIAGPITLPSVSSGNILILVKDCDFCCFWALGFPAAGSVCS